MTARTLERLDEIDLGSAAPSAVYYGGPGEVLNALNEGQRLFCLITLALETTAAFALTPATAFFHMRTSYQDWLLPLRLTNPDGTRLRPARLEELDALDVGWQAKAGAPKRYGALGFDFLIVYPQPAGGSTVNITYARAPVKMISDADVPEIVEEHHPDLVDFATYRVRAKQGGQEFAKGLPYLARFLDGAQKYAAYILSKNKGGRYDKQPFELERFDRSRLFALRPDLIPERKELGA